jgi:pyruvate,water dikinase
MPESMPGEVRSTGASPLVLPFTQIGRGDLALAGGKGANLGEMTQAGFPVPPGFCVTTAAYRLFLAGHADVAGLFAFLEASRPDDVEALRRAAGAFREELLRLPIPAVVEQAVLPAWEELGSDLAYAVRSSATAEDLPHASFAGQQESYLNVRGSEALLRAVRSCWASLFTDRAVAYRARNRFAHRAVALSVVVQRMVFPDVAGVLFTADPVSGRRGVIAIDASYGLGEGLVSGLVLPDHYQVEKCSLAIVTRRLGAKALAVRPGPQGGTVQEEVSAALRAVPALADDTIRRLADWGRRVEAHYGCPQDVEWCVAGGDVYLVQSRPITSLYPLPAPPPPADGLHVYLSFNHIQVMTEAMPPLAHSVFRTLIPFGKKGRTAESPLVASAGGRLFIDVTPVMRWPRLRRLLPAVLANADALMANALAEVTARKEFLQGRRPRLTIDPRVLLGWVVPALLRGVGYLTWWPPEESARRVDRRIHDRAAAAEERVRGMPPGAARLRALRDLLCATFPEALFPVVPAALAGFLAHRLLGALSRRWLGHDRDVIALGRGLAGNVTSDMGLAVGDLADRARAWPAVAALLREPPHPTLSPTLGGEDRVRGAETPARLRSVEGGPAFLAELEQFLARYGARCAGEIDVTRRRWREEPALVLQAVGAQLRGTEAGAHRREHARLAAEAEEAGARLVAAVRATRGGWWKARVARRLVRVSRALMALREHPKFFLVRMLGLLREVILEEARGLQARGVLEDVEDVYFLGLPEMIRLLEAGGEVRELVVRRRAEHEHYRQLTPPRVLTSDGEQVAGRRPGGALPAGALAGSGASAGVAEGPARVVLDPQTATLEKGEVLVAPGTDPGWTPLFLNAAGLVTEVGGLMTHGSVVAREYGIPAVVGVEGATRAIRTGQRVRVHGDLGYVEVLSSESG